MQLGRGAAALLTLCLIALSGASVAIAESRAPKMGVFTRPGVTIDLSVPFVGADGAAKPLRSFLTPGTPFILIPTFYHCPRLCGLTFAGLEEFVNGSALRLGSEYQIIAYSFNPEEQHGDSEERRAQFESRLKVPYAAAGTVFLTGSKESIEALNSQLDFRVRMADKEFEHSSALFIFGPSGKLVRYFAGVEFPPERVDAALRSGRGL